MAREMATLNSGTGNDGPPGADREQRLHELVMGYHTPLLSYFLRSVADRAEAEDLTQQVFLKILPRTQDIPSEKMEAFLFTVAANLLRDRWRSHKSRNVWVKNEAASEWEPQDDKLAPERLLESREILQSAAAALDTLTDKTRNMFLLLRLENKTYQEIADLYGISKSGVEKHIAKALARLASHMED